MGSECSFCYAGKVNPELPDYPVYSCGSAIHGKARSRRCYERQIAALTAQVQELKGRAEAAEQVVKVLTIERDVYKFQLTSDLQAALAAYDQGKEGEDGNS